MHERRSAEVDVIHVACFPATSAYSVDNMLYSFLLYQGRRLLRHLWLEGRTLDCG